MFPLTIQDRNGKRGSATESIYSGSLYVEFSELTPVDPCEDFSFW